MTKEQETKVEKVNIAADLFADGLQNKMANARVIKSGPYTFVTFEGSTWCMYPVAQDLYDVSGELANGEKVERQNMTTDGVEHFFLSLYREENPDSIPVSPTWEDAAENETVDTVPAASGSVSEQSTTGGVAGYNPAKAFAAPGQPVNRATLQSRKEGWEVLREAAEHLREILPNESESVFFDDSGNIVIHAGDLRLRVTPKGANLFDLETFVGEKPLPKKVQIPYAEVVQHVFDAVMAETATERFVAGIGAETDKENDQEIEVEIEDDGEDVSYSDAFEVLKELAGESGKPTDILRNKSLYDLRALVVDKNRSLTPQPYVTLREQLAEKFDRKKPAHVQALKEKTIPAHLRADNIKNGSAVSLNENRDVCRPYASTLGGKKLVMHPTQGAILVDKGSLPEGKKLSWDAKAGAVMVPESQDTKRPNWKPYWQQDY